MRNLTKDQITTFLANKMAIEKSFLTERENWYRVGQAVRDHDILISNCTTWDEYLDGVDAIKEDYNNG